MPTRNISHNAADGARANAKAIGLKVVYDKSYPPTTTDYSPIVRAIQATNPDVLVIASYPPDSVGMVRAIREVGFTPKMVGGGMVGLQATAIKTQLGPLLNGIVNYDFWLPGRRPWIPGHRRSCSSATRREAVKEGVDPLGYYMVPWAYAYLQVLGEAVEATKGLDQGKLAQYMHKTTFKTVGGDIKFGADGEWAEVAHAPRAVPAHHRQRRRAVPRPQEHGDPDAGRIQGRQRHLSLCQGPEIAGPARS